MSKNLAEIKVTTLKGVGPALTSKLSRLGIASVQDILFHLPFRYEDRTSVTPIGSVRPGDSYVLEGDIIKCDVAFGRRRSLVARLRDSTGEIALRFYHFSSAQHRNLERAGAIRCFGEVRTGASGYEIYHPEYTTLENARTMEDALTPVYPATEGISQLKFRNLVAQAMDELDRHRLPEVAMKVADDATSDSAHDFSQDLQGVDLQMNINQAVIYLHKPPPDADTDALVTGTHPVQARLAFEELVAHQTGLRIGRQELLKLTAPKLTEPGELYHKLHESLGFDLTGAQLKVSREVAGDMMTTQPTLRLIQGDVGSGKTVIAALAAIHAHENDLQTALMAPTELLAEQHFITLSTWLYHLGISTVLLSASVTGKKREGVLASIATGDKTIVIGTHALLERQVEFKHLGLIIVDEQHRFGVHQRLALREKGVAAGEGRNEAPHQLIMTATPIPRTLSMSIYANMDCSVIDELPPGRKPVTTRVLVDTRRDQVIGRVANACSKGAQAYWVCTLIEESEVLQCRAAEATAEELAKRLPELRIGLVHGRMSATEKTAQMNAFKQTGIDLLVATTVIEVGMDVPNASLMVIENAERLGLAQLHQLRGRVGRGAAESHCVLLYKHPPGPLGKQRLDVMRQSNDGFYIAERDLEIRGPGEVLGTRQSGSLQFKIADLLRDRAMLPAVTRTSLRLLAENRDGAETIVRRWIKNPETPVQV